MIIYSNLAKMEKQILSSCLQGSYRDSLGEFSNASYGVFRAERVNVLSRKQKLVKLQIYGINRSKQHFRMHAR